MERINLKVKHERTGIISEALMNFAELTMLMIGSETRNQEDWQLRFSIALQLHYHFKKKYETRYRPEKHLIKLELHEAIVLQSALLDFINTETNDYRRNEMEIVKNELHKKRTDLSKTVLT